MSDDEIIDNLHREIAHLKTNNWRLENENIALATANSELRSELLERSQQWQALNSELRAKYRAFRQAVEEAAGLRWHDDRDQAIDVALNTYD